MSSRRSRFSASRRETSHSRARMRRHCAELFLRDRQSDERTRKELEGQAHTWRARGSVVRSGALLCIVSMLVNKPSRIETYKHQRSLLAEELR